MGTGTQTFRGKATPELQGAEYFKTASTSTTPGTWQDLISETVSANKQINILRIDLTCRLEGLMEVYIDSTLIGSGRTGPATKNIGFNWVPYKSASAGEVIKVKFRAHSFRPADNVEAYLQARELDV